MMASRHSLRHKRFNCNIHLLSNLLEVMSQKFALHSLFFVSSNECCTRNVQKYMTVLKSNTDNMNKKLTRIICVYVYLLVLPST